MVGVNKNQWGPVAVWSATAFLAAGTILLLDAAIVAADIVVGIERADVLELVFVGAGWTAAFIGLFGLYPGLADRNRWLPRAGAVFAAIGAVVFAVVGVVSLIYYAGIPDGEITALVPLFLPGVVIWSILGFVAMAVASLRTDIYSQILGLLLLVPPVIVIMNVLAEILGVDSATTTLAVVFGDALAMLAIGYVLRASPVPIGYPELRPGEIRHG